MAASSKILLTGLPGVGKTTLIQKVLGALGASARGFYTGELREGGARVGFSLNLLGRSPLVLSHVKIKSPHRVGKYGVDVKTFEQAACGEIEAALSSRSLLVIDEIGKMELFSDRFRVLVLKAMKSACPVLATVLRRSHPFTDPLKAWPGVELIEVTPANRNDLVEVVVEKLQGD